jgi:cytochrome c5
MKKLLLAVLMSGSAVAFADRPVAEIYPRTCGVCHAAAVAGAPKFGDTAAWQARIDAKGMDALVKSVNTGLNAMPPKGMCMDCTPTEYQALIVYMSKGA